MLFKIQGKEINYFRIKIQITWMLKHSVIILIIISKTLIMVLISIKITEIIIIIILVISTIIIFITII